MSRRTTLFLFFSLESKCLLKKISKNSKYNFDAICEIASLLAKYPPALPFSQMLSFACKNTIIKLSSLQAVSLKTQCHYAWKFSCSNGSFEFSPIDFGTACSSLKVRRACNEVSLTKIVSTFLCSYLPLCL